MKWLKKGVIYCPDGTYVWAKHSALQPTPILTKNGLRIYLGVRDDYGVSRVVYIDVDPDNPSRVLSTPKKPVLDIGEPGTFDDNGVVPTAIVKTENKYFLYYAGYQIPSKAKFLVFGGLAISKDGENFVRFKRVPVMDRTDKELFFRVPHSVIQENNKWKVWYGSGSNFIKQNNKILPSYDTKYLESKSGMGFPEPGVVCIQLNGEDEYRIGRPYVVRDYKIYKMFYGFATISRGYRLGYAESKNGIDWVRKDKEIGIDVSPSGWDSEMIAYPAVIENNGKTYLFYNGNNMGRDGVGYAILEK